MAAGPRLPAETFRLPVEKIRSGYYSDSYFALSKELLEAGDRHLQVTMQVFAKRGGLLGGVDEALAVLRLAALAGDDQRAPRGRGGGRQAGDLLPRPP